MGKYLMAVRESKISHIYPKDKEVSNFLSECGFCEFVGVKSYLNGKAPQHNGTYIYKIRRFDFPDDYEIEQLINIIEKELKLSSNVCNHIHESLAELILNVQQHSGSKTGCFVLGQGYQKTHRVRVCISDLGIGIKNHLARKFNDLIQLDSTFAIKRALVRGVTGTLGRENSGVGLSEFREFINFVGGEFIIISGNGFYEEIITYSGAKSKVVKNIERLDFKFPGTFIDATINSKPGSKIFFKSEPIPEDYKLIR
ncbi:MAG: sensor histidine kinase [Candidatus Aureabacteria bacterium]|nr:sensor histidine kinase [Candidatus Auribacterota bacterium]